MMTPWQLWSELTRVLRRRKRSRSEHDSPSLLVQQFEERRVPAVVAVGDSYSVSSSHTLVADDAAGADFDPGNNGVLANDSGAASVASAGTFTTAQGATVTMNADGTFMYDPSTSSAVNSLAPGAMLSDTFSYTATDGMGGFSTANVDVTVTGNHAPEVVDPGPTLFTGVPRNDQDSIGASVGSLQFSMSDDDFTPFGLPPIGIALVGTNAGDGRWEFSLDFGVTWIDVGQVSDSSALLLDPDARIRYVPGPSFDQPTFSYRAWDLSQGDSGDRADASSNGGTTQFSAQTGTATAFVWTLAVPSNPIIDGNGRTQLTFVLSAPQPANFSVVIDWGDGTIEPLGLLTNGVYTISHSYAGNPNLLNPAAPIPILIEAVEFFSEEEGTFTTVMVSASPALTGNTPSPGFAPLPAPAIAAFPPPPPSEIALPTPTPRLEGDEVDIRTSGSYLAANPLRQYVLRVVTPVDAKGTVEESSDIKLADDVLEDLPGLYEKLQNDRYRLYELRRDGSYRLVQDVLVRDGVAAPVDESVQQPINAPQPGDAAAPADSGQAAVPDAANTSVAAAALGLGLVAGDPRNWGQRVDDALESSEGARRLRRLRRGKNADDRR